MNPTRCTALVVAVVSLVTAQESSAQIVAYNSGSLGAAGNGTNIGNVTLNLPGAVAAGGDLSFGYFGGTPTPHTTVPFQSALNPSATSPFTIEFWAKPGAITDDGVGPSPLFNRVSSGNRSGWVFFQRSPTSGWNFRMYDGNADAVGFDLTGGTNALDTWSHVVAVWNGSTAALYVDGALKDDTATGSGIYNASASAVLSVGSYDNGSNPFNGAMDEIAFYGLALSPAQILAHYNTAASPIPGAYSSLVLADGAIEYLQNVPEPSSVSLLLAGLVGCGALKRRRRSRLE